MLNKLLSLYLQSLVTTTILVGIASCIWIGYRALKKKDKTAKQRQAHLYDILLIDIMTIPILTFCGHRDFVYLSSTIIAKRPC